MTGTVVRCRRAVQRRAAAVAACAAALFAAMPSAGAGPIYTIKTAPSPSSQGGPIEGGGSWITNKPSGYYVGRAMVGSRFNLVPGRGETWHYGRAIDTVDMCGWIMPGSLGTQRGREADSCSNATLDVIKHRRSIGKDFNAKAHAMQTGTAVVATNSPSCIFHYNYFHGTDFARGANAGHWANAAGRMTAGTVLYRFTTLDGGAVEAKDPNLGWGFAPASCVGRPPQVFNDDD
jgi:hypothetical protein